MDTAKSLIKEQPILSEVSAEQVLNSIVVSGIQNSDISVVDTLVEGMPEAVQGDIRVQKIIAEINRLEQGYLPLVQDLYHSSIFAHPERYILMFMGILLIGGIVLILNEWLGGFVFLVLFGFIFFGLVVRYRAIKVIKEEIADMKFNIVEQMDELKMVQESIIAQSGATA